VAAAELSWRDIVGVIVAPERVLAERLASPPSITVQLTHLVAPAAAVRAAAMVLQSLFLGAPLTGFVLGLGSLTLQIGTWLGVGLAVPPLARQFNVHLDERQGLLVTALASMPLWLAGALHAVPETAPFLYYWSRTLVLVVAAYGVYIAARAFTILGLAREARLPLLAGLSAAYVALYLVLFTLLGVSLHIVLFFVGPA
jgi:hypothetical protein